MKVIAPLFDAGELIGRPVGRVARPKVSVTGDEVSPVAGVLLWGELLDRFNLVGAADLRGLRPIGSGGYSGGECYRTLVETILAGGDCVADVRLLAGQATGQLRGDHRLPSHPTVWRFGAGADLGRVQKAAATNRVMLARAWAAGAGPTGGVITIDPDATTVEVYGSQEGARHSYKHEPALSPLIGVCGETGDVLGVRARGGNAQAGRALASFTVECVYAIPEHERVRSLLWVRSDAAGYRREMFDTCNRLGVAFSITAAMKPNVRKAIQALATDPTVTWMPALGHEHDRGSEVAETTIVFTGRGAEARRAPLGLRLIVRRQPVAAGDQQSFDDLDGWRFHAIATNLPDSFSPERIEHHHRLRGGLPEDAIRRLKEAFGLNHAPFHNFYGNWLWWHAAALAHNVARWLQVLTLPAAFHRCRAKRLRLAFFNVAGRVVRHAGQLHLRLSATHPWGAAFIEALTRVRQLPAYA